MRRWPIMKKKTRTKKRKVDLDKIQRQLTALERRLMDELHERLSNVQNTSRGDPSELLDMVAEGEIDYMSAVSAESGSATIDEVHEALRKLRNGTYGVCESCGEAIKKRRLKARLFAVLCIGCKERKERLGYGEASQMLFARGGTDVTVSLTDEDAAAPENHSGDLLRNVEDIEVSELF
jgi:DnaK suppressor protein